MSNLELSLLGQVAIHKDGVVVTGFRSSKAVALLCYLAVTGRPCARSILVGLLWGELPEENAQMNLRKVLTNLRDLVGPHLSTTRQTVAFNRESTYWLDTEQFEAGLRDLSGAIDVEQVRGTVNLYRGDFLAGLAVRDAVAFEEWVREQQARLKDLALHALERLASHAIEQGHDELGIQYTRRLLDLEPWREEAHQQLMVLLARIGQRNAALAQYAICRRVLAEELAVEPSAETTALYQRLRAHAPAKGSPTHLPLSPPGTTRTNTQPPRKTNLSLQLTSFIGREQELATLKRLLANERLVTLTGAGGCGKTRLALQVAADLIDGYPDGVWLVELSSVSDPALVPQVVAAAVGGQEHPDRTPTAVLNDTLCSKRALLLLDNCEHLVAACAELAETLLRSCSELRILATSREALNIPGEVRWIVPSLSESEAVRLFVERAASIQPAFTLAPQNSPAIAQICRQLDGIPLAIELAAARVGTLSVEEIALRLDNAFHLLTAGHRTTPSRHRTLQATIDWSHALLSEVEQVLLRRLAIFAGSWTLEAAEAVCPDDRLLPPDVFGALSDLVDKSLVSRREQIACGQTRYQMLETVRQYAHQKLVQAGEVHGTRDRHLNFFTGLAEGIEPKLYVVGQNDSLNCLEADYDNLKAALQWGQQWSPEAADRGELGLRLAGALISFWYMRGYWREGRQWLESFLVQPVNTADLASATWATARAKTLAGAGLLAWGQNDYQHAITRFEESLALFQQVDNKQETAWVLLMLGRVAGDTGDRVRAVALVEQSLALERLIGHKRGIGFALWVRAKLAREQGDWDRATRLLDECEALFREEGHRWAVALALTLSCWVVRSQGDPDRAAAQCSEALAIWRELGDERRLGYTLPILGLVKLDQGDYPAAHLLHMEALALLHAVGDKLALARCLEGLAKLACVQGHLERAARLFGAAQVIREKIGAPLPPTDQAEHDRYVARVQTRWDTTTSVAWTEGRAMKLDEIIEYTSIEPDPPR